MQKKIIALAVAAAFSAPAFAESSFYGILDAGVVNVSASGQKSDLLAISGGASQSRIGFKANEDLGSGMKAVLVMEYGLDTDVSTGLTGARARQNLLALAGDFGTVAAGYLQTTVYDFNAKYDPVYGSKVSPTTSVTKGNFLMSDAARASHAVAYISPSFSGVKVALNYSTGLADASNLGVASNATAGLKTTAFLMSADYTDGPISVTGVYGKTADDDAATATGPTTVSEVMLGGSYDLGMAKVMGAFASSSATVGTNPSAKNTVFTFSAVMPVATGAIAASYAANKMNAANSNGSGFLVGYLHTLSKDTTAYVALEQVSNGSATRAYTVASNALSNPNFTLGGSSTLIGAGLRKKF